MRFVATALTLLALTFAAVNLGSPEAVAQAGIEVQSQSVDNQFPDGAVFTVLAVVDSPIQEVRLRYSIAPDGTKASGVAECTGDTTASCTFALGDTQRTFLIPGSEITYYWDIHTSGASLETEPQLFVYEDTRFEWESLSEGNVTLWWYAGGQEEAQAVLSAAWESIAATSELLRTTVDFPVKVFYYASAEEMQPAILPTGTDGVVTLGEVVYSDTAMVSADLVPLDIARHEVAHIVIRQATKGPFSIPDWLNEGTAVLAQSEPFSGQQQALERAIRRDEVFSIHSLSSASAGGTAGKVDLFYGQSWSTVSFLVDNYGPEKFAELFAVFKEGSTTDKALLAVYGFDQDELEARWRQSVGLPPREPVQPSENGAAEPSLATPAGEEEPAAAEGTDDGFPIVAAAAIAVLAVAVVGIAGLGAFALMRRR